MRGISQTGQTRWILCRSPLYITNCGTRFTECSRSGLTCKITEVFRAVPSGTSSKQTPPTLRTEKNTRASNTDIISMVRKGKGYVSQKREFMFLISIFFVRIRTDRVAINLSTVTTSFVTDYTKCQLQEKFRLYLKYYTILIRLKRQRRSGSHTGHANGKLVFVLVAVLWFFCPTAE